MFHSGFYITAELRILDENKILETREALQSLCTMTLLQEPECSMFQLHQCQQEPRRLLLWERFDSEQAYQAHFKQVYTQEYLARNLTEVVQHFVSDCVL
ncbi:antibiotic biosynthesis monooxygenase [Acinetobacter bereziniae]|uniref:putative quinol monooxygenase n=1 Tax=Acinetobacter bereziniae TaxID=106648 RepID=UPI000C2BB567|nr:antibiotic biosynthesis monooxygenase [Acinetobacter bereziniae]ATZ65660.1 carboxymuconolactone decarboxylase [Acinetobacter bereziniae]MDG3558266.1 antibiotic biosynthesis monooxygenase [Acinetobacter bereziniae]MDP6003453.1 antibiotic biosynthesis monooxygenase [Acinetobacter bereziniae]QQC80528.1 antibiotic biosynthesis monooxygenase [Acinetobacter bereziniae]UUN93620.1 antibiotic biosynthesis monooxygenase [Acinetobacter bereziniae]